MLYRLIRNIYYQQAERVTLSPIMNGKKLAIVISHDCDANRPDLWAEYARREHEQGVKTTFMIYTKLNRDGYDVPFYLRSIDAIANVTTYGHELGSHSVAHSE